MLSFVAEEDLRIETSCPLNEVTAVLMLKNFLLIIIYHAAMNPYHITYYNVWPSAARLSPSISCHFGMLATLMKGLTHESTKLYTHQEHWTGRNVVQQSHSYCTAWLEVIYQKNTSQLLVTVCICMCVCKHTQVYMQLSIVCTQLRLYSESNLTNLLQRFHEEEVWLEEGMKSAWSG